MHVVANFFCVTSKAFYAFTGYTIAEREAGSECREEH